jgi:hypothetical protein
MKKPIRVEMIDRLGNIARPLPEHVPDWEAVGWTRVQPKGAGKAKKPGDVAQD